MTFSLRSMALLLAGLSALSTPAAATNLIGDVIFGTYDAPCDTCDAIEQYEYSVNGFTVDAVSQETTLNIIDGDIDTGVDFGASLVVFTFQQDVTWVHYAFNGPEFFVLSGNPFWNVISVTSPPGQPVDMSPTACSS
jgi:hypothetical protein